MELLFKQRIFSWFDSYDIYNEEGNAVFKVKGRPSWGHCLQIYDPQNRHVGTVKEVLFAFRPKFQFYVDGICIGEIKKRLSFSNHYNLDCNGWRVHGNIAGWNYSILDSAGNRLAAINKKLLTWTDTYVIDVADPKNALLSLMIVLAIDAEKCTND